MNPSRIYSFTRSGDLTARFRPLVTRSFLYWVPPSAAGLFDAQEIIDRLWLGSVRAAFDEPGLEQHQIKYALTVADGMIEFVEKKHTSDANSANAVAANANPHACVAKDSWFEEHAVVPINDAPSENILEHLEEALSFVDECLAKPSGSILVHCAAGVSRSVSVVVAYLVTRKQMKVEEALAKVKSLRPIAFPNRGFLEQLYELERHNGDFTKARDAFQARCKRDPSVYMLMDII